MLWGPRIKYFTKNFYDYAKMGYFIRFLHTIARVGKFDPTRLLSATSRAEQEQVFEKDIAPFFDNWFVRATGNMPVMLYSLGIPPQQFSAMETETPGGLVGMYRERVKRLACDFPISDNYFGWQAFGRSYDRASRYRDAGVPEGRKFPDAARQPRPRVGDEHDADRVYALAAG